MATTVRPGARVKVPGRYVLTNASGAVVGGEYDLDETDVAPPAPEKGWLYRLIPSDEAGVHIGGPPGAPDVRHPPQPDAPADTEGPAETEEVSE